MSAKATNKKSSARKKPNSSTYARTNAPRRPARVKSESDMVRDKEIAGIVLITLAVILLVNFILAPQGQSGDDVNTLGIISLFFLRLLRTIAGSCAVVLPIFLLVLGIMICADRNRFSRARVLGLMLVLVSVLGLCQLSLELTGFRQYVVVAAAGRGGGAIGALISFALLKTIGLVATRIIYIALIVIGLLLAFQTTLRDMGRALIIACRKLRQTATFHSEQDRPAPIATMHEPTAEKNSRLARRDPTGPPDMREVPVYLHDTAAPLITEQPVREGAPIAPTKNRFSQEFMPDISAKPAPQAAEPALTPDPQPTLDPISAPDPECGERPQVETGHAADMSDDDAEVMPDNMSDYALKKAQRVAAKTAAVAPPIIVSEQVQPSYKLPSEELIEPGLKLRNPRMNKAITENISVLENTLESFGVRATVTQVVAGPAVTRYELQPAPGVKVARITSLSDDIALSLAAQAVRIEAPIPGKSAIGIEVARKETDTVYFREMIDSDEFRNSKPLLSFALGKNIGGDCIIGNLAKMPHLLIAGATGSGKSICLNTIICSILYKATPDQVKLMLVDPKKVEMTQYAHLPHLIAPVVNDSKKAANALKWVVNEMENRYSLFAGSACKDFDGYNKQNPETPLPYIVVIIDELADLMLVAKRDVEESICRLAQMARAAGIHLVVATQRPSVDVITGLIKANIPSRIAFAVSSYTDSRTILDMGGAEKLLGRGDMLYAPIGKNKPERVQGSFVAEKDVNRLVQYCADQCEPQFSEPAIKAAEGLLEKTGGGAADDGDELLYDAAMLIISSGQASTSFLQRRLAIGNPRAARLMDMLEAKGVVGGHNGSKPREILMTVEQVEAMYH